MIEERNYSLRNKIGYGIGDMYAGGAFLLVNLLYLNFLTDVVGLNPKLAGLAFLIGKVWDAISDPLMGFISDRTKTRLGRRRFYFALGIVPIFLSFSMLWLKVDPNSIFSAIYYIFSYIFFTTSFTLVMVPYNALLPNMIKSYDERTSFNMYRMIFSSISAILSGVVPMMIIQGVSNRSTGYLIMGVIFGLIYAIPWIFVLFLTWENPINQTQIQQHSSIKSIFKEFKQSFKNKCFRIHAGFYVSSQTAADFLTTIFIYYLTYVLNREKEFSAVLGTLLVVQLLSMPFHGFVAKKYGKKVPLIIGMITWIVGLTIALFINSSSPGFLIYIVAALSGVGGSSAIFVPWSILPDISDVDEIITGKRREGVYAGMSTLIRKIAQAISVFIIGVYLDEIGYIPNVSQESTVINGIRLIFFTGPFIFIIIALIFILSFKMNSQNHQILMNEIKSRKETKEVSQDKEVIKVCESLTGHRYNELKIDVFNE